MIDPAEFEVHMDKSTMGMSNKKPVPTIGGKVSGTIGGAGLKIGGASVTRTSPKAAETLAVAKRWMVAGYVADKRRRGLLTGPSGSQVTIPGATWEAMREMESKAVGEDVRKGLGSDTPTR